MELDLLVSLMLFRVSFPFQIRCLMLMNRTIEILCGKTEQLQVKNICLFISSLHYTKHHLIPLQPCNIKVVKLFLKLYLVKVKIKLSLCLTKHVGGVKVHLHPF